MNDIMYYLVQFIIIFVIGLITKYLIPWLKTKSDNEALQHIEEWVRNAVSAAEQVITGSLQGANKKEYVLDNIHKLLNEKGIKITEEQLEMLIEAAVKAMNADKTPAITEDTKK